MFLRTSRCIDYLTSTNRQTTGIIMFAKRLFSPTVQSITTKFFEIRQMSSMKMDATKGLLYKGYGEPADVLEVVTENVKQPGKGQVSVRWLMSPVNPADINTIQGKYPSKPALPAVPGNEGVGEVAAVGPDVKKFQVGDRVVPNGVNQGTWRTLANYSTGSVLKIPKDIGIVEASMLNVNPCTAYRMLKDFVPLKPGDTVIQNGGNSAVGQMVIQLCKIWNYKSVNIIRDRPDIDELKNKLKCLGADEVLTEAEVRTTSIFKESKLPAPKLALNCVCGKIGSYTMKHLANGGIMVTYGAMSREPVIAPASAFIFQDVILRGFWMTAWTNANMESKERETMLYELGEFFKSKKLQPPPYKVIPFTEYKEAVVNALNPKGQTGIKYILDMSQ